MIKDTGDTRETAAAFVCKDLLEERASLAVYDPKVVCAINESFGDVPPRLYAYSHSLPHSVYHSLTNSLHAHYLTQYITH